MLLNTTDETESIDPADIELNKTYGGLAYFLFFLPLLKCPDSKYGRFHANQGLLLLIFSVGLGIIGSIIATVLTWRLWWLSSLISLAFSVSVLAIGIIGLMNGFKGQAKELPIIGRFRLIK